VNSIIQPWLPKLKGVKKIKKPRKPPQPSVKKFQVIRKYELLHRPFDLRFRGRINKWLEQLVESDVDIASTLGELETKIIQLYFFPQKRRWLNQNEVIKKIKGVKLYQLRSKLVAVLLEIWEYSRNAAK
jgi:hypothetical protein